MTTLKIPHPPKPQHPVQIADCAKCPLYHSDTFVPPLGNPETCDLIVCAQAPGQDEVRQRHRQPLIGAAGTKFRTKFTEAGGELSRTLLMNTVQCMPPNDRKPTPREIRACKPYVNHLLTRAKARKILALGDVAARAHAQLPTGLSFMKTTGYDYPHTTYADMRTFVTIHPSYVIRNIWEPFVGEVFTRHLKKCWTWTIGLLRYTEGTYIYVDSYEKLEPHIQSLHDANIITVDIETTGLNPRKDKILGIALSYADHRAIAIPWHDGVWWGGAAVRSILAEKRTEFQNGLFDIAFLTHAGYEVAHYAFDTNYAHRLTYPDGLVVDDKQANPVSNFEPNSLRFLSSIYTTMPFYKSEFASVYAGKSVSSQDIARLACLDVDATRRVSSVIRMELKTLGVHDYFNQTLMPAMPCVNAMHTRGVRIDKSFLARVYAVAVPKLERIKDKYTGINLKSPKQLGDWLVAQGFKLPRTASNKYYTTNISEVKQAADKKNTAHSVILGDLIEFSELHKIVSTYVEGLFSRIEDDRLYTTFKIPGASTMRMASRNPNLQNIDPEVRPAFIPDPEHLWCKADYASIELRIAALLAGELRLLNDLDSGVSVHREMQKEFYRDRYDPHDGHQYRRAKTGVYGAIYGRSPHSLAIEHGVTRAEAQLWIDVFSNRYPRVSQYQQEQVRQAQRQGYVRSIFGNIRYTDSATKVLNFPMQAGAAAVLYRAMARVAQHLDVLQPLITVHDELDFQIPKDCADEHISLITSCMRTPIPEFDGYAFPIELQTGENWKHTHIIAGDNAQPTLFEDTK